MGRDGKAACAGEGRDGTQMAENVAVWGGRGGLGLDWAGLRKHIYSGGPRVDISNRAQANCTQPLDIYRCTLHSHWIIASNTTGRPNFSKMRPFDAADAAAAAPRHISHLRWANMVPNMAQGGLTRT